MANFNIQVKVIPSVDTEDAVVYKRLLEIWLNAKDGREINVERTDDGRYAIRLVEIDEQKEKETFDYLSDGYSF